MQRQLKGLILSSSISGMLTTLFMLFFVGMAFSSALAGFCIGFFAYLSIYLYKTRVEPFYSRKLNLLLLLLLNTIVQVLLILLVTLFFIGIIFLKGDFKFFFSEHFSLFRGIYLIGLLYGLILSMIFSFLSIVSNIIGKNILPKLFIGRYRSPVEEERIFMFLDIASSTTIAEKIGHLNYLSLLNDFFYDVADPVYRTKGEIYKYVGDEVIITWKMKNGLADSNCVRCFFLIDETISDRSDYYHTKYGLVPEFKAGLHSGMAVIGEVGMTKREIAFVGDVLNTTARIESECKNLNKRLLASEDLVKRINLPGYILKREVGTVKLRGKEKEIRLFSLSWLTPG
ncbi:MAG: adenylate/guanylate cyclase domain-containing protein [Bacteroidales bacterium]|jgi:adenylate cyclase|nr:adenylate/guanylate cyclase domain-containing protein [Bacteroidales bacterium]